MAQKIIKGPVDDNSLNSTNHNFTELYDGKRKANERINNIVDEMSDEAFNKVVNSAKLDWDTMVEKHSDLPSDAETGTTIGVKEDSLVYRYDGSKWVDIYEINLNPISEVDDRLSSQLAETDSFRRSESTINRKKRSPMITLVVDDGNKGFYTDLRPLLLEYGIVATSALITHRRRGFPGDDRPAHSMWLNYEEIMQMKKEGTAEFISHTHTHDLNNRYEDMSREERIADMIESRNFLKKHGLNYRAMAYAFGSYTQEVVEDARLVWDYCIGTGTKGDKVVVPPFDNYDMRRTHGEQGLTRVKAGVDKARDENGWVMLTLHMDQGDWWSEQYMRDIIEYALSQGLKFVTTEEGYKTHGNIAQFGKNTITSEGEFYGEDFAYLGRNALTPDDVPSNPLLYGRKTVTDITTSGADGFPEDSKGQLVTVAYQKRSAYQYYYIHDSYRAFLRQWYDPWDSWGNWSLVQDRVMYYPADRNDFNANTPRANFRNGETISAITSNDDLTGTPQGRPGLLTTYIIPSGGIRHHYQEFQDYSNGSIFRRQGTGTTDNGWDAWKTIFEGD